MCLKEETTSLAIIILDNAEAQKQLHGWGAGGAKGGITVQMRRKELVISNEFEWC